MLGLEFKNLPDTTTPINATNLNNMQLNLLDITHPIGEYYETSNADFNPNTYWGGTWELENDGAVLASKSDTIGSAFNVDIGTIIGEEEHTMTIDELVSHNHTYIAFNKNITTTDVVSGSGVISTQDPYNEETSSVGGSQPFNIIQTSKIVYRWHRIA